MGPSGMVVLVDEVGDVDGGGVDGGGVLPLVISNVAALSFQSRSVDHPTPYTPIFTVY